MSLANYFDNVKGIGILGTANPEGKVDLALYARPLTKESMPSAVGTGFQRRKRVWHELSIGPGSTPK